MIRNSLLIPTINRLLTRQFHNAPITLGSNKLQHVVEQQLQEIREAGTYKHERIITTQQKSIIKVKESDQGVINFCANNYLGLSNRQELIDAAKKTLDTHGFGLSSVRFICGTQDIHKELEKNLAQFHQTQDTILFPSCFDANAGIFETILTAEDAVISDSLNHASIIDGIRLCKAKRLRYNHLDMNDLESKLKEAKDSRIRLIATDGVFSMDGDIAPLDKIVELAEKYDANIFVDDCHATGFIGATGRGTPEYFNVTDKIDIVNSTLGKALGGATGGYTTGHQWVVDLLRQRARPYLFSNSVAPSVVGASLQALKLIEHDTSLRDTLMRNTTMFRKGMKQAGFTISGHDDCPIAPVMIGDARIAATFADEMLKMGIYVISFSYPVVPKGQARIRVQLSAAHTQEQVQKTIDAFIKVGKQTNLLK
ncbi:2-amino-3-ketobutyrate coenzyme A ligase [Acrasis kona]|uniref:2-amino-3-ketobutyrate coenzyme A ligase, mitochondrial n=1 Tax=Acrasis kona TaxID=1008807 RepID=A0AAW2ZBM6_9EUKA